MLTKLVVPVCMFQLNPRNYFEICCGQYASEAAPKKYFLISYN
jgi:hypothetical protein